MQPLAQVERISDRACRADLTNHLDQEAEAERGAEMIESRAKELMQPHEWLDPWSFKIFTEAIENAPEGERKVMCATLAEASSRGLNDNMANHLALVSINQMVTRYWKAIAIQEAKKEMQ